MGEAFKVIMALARHYQGAIDCFALQDLRGSLCA
jgi:hypothetical protein